jgi:hypothetical protein
MKLLHILLIIMILILIYLYIHKKKESYKDYVIYIPNFLDTQEYDSLLKSLKNDSRPYDINKNGLLKRTIIDKKINNLFYSPKYIQQLSQLTGKQIMSSKIPIEYRIYQLHNGMNWHIDTLLYEEPQYECVYTIHNTSDSKTEYIDYNKDKHSLWTEPNSLMIVRANGYFHHVKPVKKGKREILKLIYTPTKKINLQNMDEYKQAFIGNT